MQCNIDVIYELTSFSSPFFPVSVVWLPRAISLVTEIRQPGLYLSKLRPMLLCTCG